jgi:hypothetical protein
VNEYQHAAQTILDARNDHLRPSIRTYEAVSAHRAALERIATGQAVVVDRDHLEVLYLHALESTPPRLVIDAKAAARAAIAAQEGNADA